MKTSLANTITFGSTLVAATVAWNTATSSTHDWYEFMLGPSASSTQKVVATAFGIAITTTAFAIGASRFQTTMRPTNAFVAGIVVSLFSIFFIVPYYLSGMWRLHAGWTILAMATLVSFFAPLLFGGDEQSPS